MKAKGSQGGSTVKWSKMFLLFTQNSGAYPILYIRTN